MKAIRCREWGAPDLLRLEEAERSSLERHQVRIRVHAAGVNFADSLMVGGTYQVRPPFPFTPGLEAAGEIVETGNAVDGLRVGQRALAVLRNGGGSWGCSGGSVRISRTSDRRRHNGAFSRSTAPFAVPSPSETWMTLQSSDRVHRHGTQ